MEKLAVHAPVSRATRRLIPWAALLCAWPFAPACADASGDAHPPEVDVSEVTGPGFGARVVNGVPTMGYPAVGLLLYRSGDAFVSHCTATLIGCSTILTAAHCVASDKTEDNYRFYLQHGGLFSLKTIAWQKQDYREPTANGERADIAVLGLTDAVAGIAPRPINQEFEHPPNVPGYIVGFGSTGSGSSDHGLKRYGHVKSAACRAGSEPNEMVCWNFSGAGSNTCGGDSGGPMFSSENRAQEVITGVTSGGVMADCGVNDHSFDTSVFRYRSWIASAAGADLGVTACGAVTPLPTELSGDTKRFAPRSGQLSPSNPMHRFLVKARDAHELRVAVNVARFFGANDEPAARPRLVVAEVSQPDAGPVVCKSDTGATAAFCSIPLKDGVAYTITLDRYADKGRADFQLIVTVF